MTSWPQITSKVLITKNYFKHSNKFIKCANLLSPNNFRDFDPAPHQLGTVYFSYDEANTTSRRLQDTKGLLQKYLFSDNTDCHPPTHPSNHPTGKMEQDFKYLN